MNKLSFLVLCILLHSCSQSNISVETSQHEIDLAGKEIPELVAPGIINQGLYVRDLVMTPDQKEIYFTVNMGRFDYAHIAFIKFENGKWTKPELAPFANNPRFKYFEPFISPDRQRFFFVSNQTEGEPEQPFRSNIWVADRLQGKWAEPYKLDTIINSSFSQYFPSVTKDGTLYFTREDSLRRKNTIYRAKYNGENYQKPEALPAHINTGRDRFNACISADESYLILPIFGLKDSYGATDYYISFKNEIGQWSIPQNMGNKINSESGLEYAATISPDGKTMYFMSSRIHQFTQDSIQYSDLQSLASRPESGKANIYKISTAFFNDLKKQARFK